MPTPSLRELQALVWRAIAATPGTLAPDAALLAVTEPSETLDARARLSVYADAYFWRLRDALAENFPRLAAILGPDRFEDLARTYLTNHPSEDPSVRNVGGQLAAMIVGRRDLPPWLADLARLEWTRLEVFDAPDAGVLVADDLRAVPPDSWPGLRFTPVPSLALLRADRPVHEAWTSLDAPDLQRHPTVLRVWRARDGRVFHAPMDPRAADALSRLIEGQSFAEICAAFADLPPHEAGREAIALLARWLEDGIIGGIVPPS